MADPKIKYDIEANVNGSTSVEDLERHLRQLGGVLEGDLAPQAIAAADAIKSLGEKQAAVDTLRSLSNESSAVAVELQQAQHQVDQLGTQMAETATRAQAFARAELQAKAALEGKSADLERARTALRQMQAETTGAARSTEEYRQGTTALRGDIQRLVAEVGLERAALKNTEAQARNAQQAQNALSGQYGASVAALMRMRGAQQDSNAALDAARDRLRATGIDTSNLSQAERNLAAAMMAVRQEALQIVPAYTKVIQSTQQVATETKRTSKTMREGMDSISAQLQNIQSIATAALGGGFAAGLLKDVTDTADAFNNLSARVKLATGEGENFEAGFKGVQRVALETRSALEGTGVLFSRIVSAGKEFNLTQEAALGVTQSINQAVQLASGSAASADAAITQLIQGLQSGVLRGEEFNSVMEQAPRLAQALADGLGVTTGQLRTMAQAGELTSKTVITALQSQSAALQEEFTKLPATVGRAITNLQTQWTLFVGGLDSSTGVTSYVANGINLIANNLDTVVRVATLAGAALMASLGVQAVAALRAYAAEAAVAAGATNILSASIAKVPKTVNIVVAVTGFELGYQVGEMLRENSVAARQLGVAMVGYFEVVVNSLRLAKEAAAAVFTSDTIDAAYDRYMQRNQQVRESIQAMMVDAEQAPTKVADAAAQASGQLQGVGSAATAAGQQVAAAGAAGAAGVGQITAAGTDALSIFKALLAEASKPAPKDGAITGIVRELVNAKAKGLDLDALLRAKLPDALSKLSGPELAKFRQDFVAAMRDAGVSGQELQTGLRLIGEQAARSLGVDLAASATRASEAFRKTDEDMRLLILSLPQLKAAGIDTGRVVGEALTKMLDGAKNQAEIDAVIKRVQALRGELGAPLADGLLDQAKQKAQELKDKLDESTPGINSLAEAMKNLGLTSTESLQRTASEAQQAFDVITQAGAQEGESYLAWQRRKEAAAMVMVQRMVEANGGIMDASIKARAAAAGLKVETDESGRTIVRSMRDAEEATHRVGRAAKGAAGDYRDMGAAAAESAKKLKELYDRNRLGTFDESSDAIEKARQNKSGNAAILQTDINQQIKDRYGEEFIGNDKAEAAFQRRLELNNYRKKYGNVMRSQQSLNEERNIAAELDRLEREIEAERQANARGGAAAPGTRAPAPAPTPAERTTRGGGVSSGATTVVNLSYNGSRVGSVNTDAAGRRSIESFIRALSDDKMRS